jgi:hypothetical protein
MLDHKSDFKVINPKKEKDYKYWFLSQFKDGKKYIAYKFLTKDWQSPINNKKITYEKGKIYKEECDEDINNDCGKGINLATLNWCKLNNDCNGIYVKFSFDPKDAIVPKATDGKFRVSYCVCEGKI